MRIHLAPCMMMGVSFGLVAPGGRIERSFKLSAEKTSVVSKRAGVHDDDYLGGPPPGMFELVGRAISHEFEELQKEQSEEIFVLSNEAIWERERSRVQVESPWAVKIPYYALCYFLDALFEGRPIARFWFLETVARMPYFAYVSCLHLYETVGWWRISAEAKRVHFAQEWNEFHHLCIMERLGGDRRWADRFFAQHSAIIYYWVLVFLWLVSPKVAYNFSELIEAHAVDTYSEFLDANEEKLREIPAPTVAKEYYEQDKTRLDFVLRRGDEHDSIEINEKCETLYDVFENIRDDEKEHVCVAAASATEGAKVAVVDPDASENSKAVGVAVAVATIAFGKYFSDSMAASQGISVVADDAEASAAGLSSFFDGVVDVLVRILPFTL